MLSVAEIGSPLLYMPGAPGDAPGGGVLRDPTYLENYYRLQKDALERQFENQRMMLAHEHQVLGSTLCGNEISDQLVNIDISLRSCAEVTDFIIDGLSAAELSPRS